MMNDPCSVCAAPGVDRISGHDLCRACSEAHGQILARRLGFTVREERFERQMVKRVRTRGGTERRVVTVSVLQLFVHIPHPLDLWGTFTAESQPEVTLPDWLRPRRDVTDFEIGEPSFDDLVEVQSADPDGLVWVLGDESVQTAITELIRHGRVKLEPGVVLAETWQEGEPPDSEALTREAVLLALHLDRAGQLA